MTAAHSEPTDVKYRMLRRVLLEAPHTPGSSDDMAMATIVEATLHTEFRAGVFRDMTDAIMVADVILASMSEASTDTRDFFTDAPALLTEILGENPKMPERMPRMKRQAAARAVLAQRLAADLGPFGFDASPANIREIDQMLRWHFSFGPWAEIAMTVGITRKDILRLETSKAERVSLLLGFVVDTLKDLVQPVGYLGPKETEEFRVIGERAA